MKKTLLLKLLIFLFVSLSLSNSTIGQTVVASWSFDALVGATDALPTANIINADFGPLASNATIYLNGTNGSSNWVSVTTNPELTAFGGSTLNDPRTPTNSGNALSLANTTANGKSVIFKFSTIGHQGVLLSFSTRGTTTGFNTHTWEWSTDNVTYTAFGTNTAVTTTTFLQKTIDMTAITAVNNAPTVYIKLTLSGATSSSGNNRIDNFVVRATDVTPPTPVFNPANSSTNAVIWTKPTITFNEIVRKTDGTELVDGDLASLISFKKTDALGANVVFTATIDAAKKVIKITPSANLDNLQAYYLSIGAVEDLSGNEALPANVTFTTISATSPGIMLTSPVGGEIMYDGQAVSITWNSTNITNLLIEVWAPDEPGTYAWSTYIASTPAASGKVDNIVPADAPYGTEYKIRISDLSNPAVSSTGSNFTIIGVASTLAELKARFLPNDIYKYTGTATITYLRGSAGYYQKYIQDATAALVIHDPNNLVQGTYVIGDGITNVEGKISPFAGLIEMVPLAATGTKTTGSTIVPEIRTLASITSADQAKLIKIEKMKFTTPTGNFGSGKSYTLDGIPAGTLVFYTLFAEADYLITPTAMPTAYLDGVVLVGQSNAVLQVTPRSWSDITLLSGAKAITSFAFTTPSAIGTIDETGKTVSVAVPSGTNVTALVPTIAVSAKAAVSPASGAAQNFTSPVNYTVTAEDGTTQIYAVTVSVVTGIERGNDRNIVMYPVPATSELNVRNITGVNTIEILDVTGKVVLRLDNVDQNEVKIPVSNLRKGMYFMKLTTPEGKIIKRFVKS